jgi:transketolase
VREISAIGGAPGLVMLAPSCPEAVAPLLNWCLDVHEGPSFLRMASLPVAMDHAWPEGTLPAVGCGVALTEGADAVLIGSGPVLLAQAVKAARILSAEGVGLKVIDLPWLNRIDDGWLAEAVAGSRLLVTLDDHYVEGGQGEKVLAALARAGRALPVLQLGLHDVPPCGQPAEVLERLGLDAEAIARAVRSKLG